MSRRHDSMVSHAAMARGSAVPDAGRPAQAAFASVEVHRSFDSVAPLWRSLMAQALATPYQAPAFQKAWLDHVAGHERVEPLIVVARESDGRVVALLPFGVRRRLGVATAGFLGGSHVNYNLAVIRRDRLARFTPREVRRLFRVAAAQSGVDVFALTNQPHDWDGEANPLAALPRQPSPDAGFSGPLAASLEDHFRLHVSGKTRSAQRRKMRRFEENGTPRLYRAETDAERRCILDVYFAQKAERLGARGIHSVFEKPGVHEFIAAAAGLDAADPAIELYGFDLDDRTIATFGTITDGVRMCGMFNSISNCDLARYSPGELLLNFMVEDAIRRGMKRFDLGVGAAPYKAMYCPDREPLFDSIFGVTMLGRSVAAALAAKSAAKARVKANPTAYGLVERIRKFKAKAPSREDAKDGA